MTEPMTLAGWVKALREHLGLTQRAFARKLGINKSTVARWEINQTYPHPLMCRILTHLGRDAGLGPMPGAPEESTNDA